MIYNGNNTMIQSQLLAVRVSHFPLRNFVGLLSLMCTVWLFGCAPPYRAAEFGSCGYIDTKVTKTIFKICYQGGPTLEGNTVECFALNRAAEVARMNGFPLFRIRHSALVPSIAKVHSPIIVTSERFPTTNYAQMLVPTSSAPVSFSAYLTIECMHEPDSDAEMYSANEVLENLRDKVSSRKS